MGPVDATDKALVWTGSDESVATVSKGTITAIAPGVATIMATAHDGGGATALCEVTVNAKVVEKQDQVISGTDVYGKTEGDAAFTLDAKLEQGDGALSYESSDPAVALVDASGKVTVGKAGTATITVTAAATDAYNAASMEVAVTVQAKAAPPADMVKVSAILLDTEQLELEVGQYEVLAVTVVPSDATNKDITWTSSNKQVASVDADGVVAAKKAGTATVKAHALDGSGVTASCEVVVTADEPEPTTVDIADCFVELESDWLQYTGKAVKPVVSASYGGVKLKEGTDYALSGDTSAIEEGDYSITVAGKGDYAGSKTLEYTIYKPASGDDDDPFTVEDGVLVMYNGSASNVVVPNGVTAIGDSAFGYNESIVSVILPKGVESIGDFSFSGCTGLKEINVPSTLQKIGEGAFNGCASLSKISLPSNLKSIGESAFASAGLTAIAIPEGIKAIPNFAFSWCKSLKSVALPNGATSIGDDAFFGCEKLASIDLPDGLKSIGDSAFYGCAAFAEVVIPGNVTNIDAWAFSGCDNVKSATFEGSAPAFGNYCFPSNEGMTVTYPAGDSSWTEEVLDGQFMGDVTFQEGSSTKPAKDPDPKPADKKKQKITVGAKTYNKTYGDKPFSVDAETNGDGKLSYFSTNSKVASVSAIGQVKIVGAGKADIIVSASATDVYQQADATIAVNVEKAANKFTAKAKKKTLTTNVKKKAQAIKASAAFKVTNPIKGKVTYKKTSGNKKITVAKNGKITVKKGLKKGTYPIRVKVACSKANYNTANKTVTLKVKVK